MNGNDLIMVIDFGGQYNQLIARRIRDLGVNALIYPYNIAIEEVKKINPKGIIFTGGPNSVYLENSLKISKDIFGLKIPILGICYGAQLIAYILGGSVKNINESDLNDVRTEYGKTETSIVDNSDLFEGVDKTNITWMSHNDYIDNIPEGFRITASTKNCKVAAMEDRINNIYAVQFHPEVKHTVFGDKIFSNFIYSICKCENTWKMENFLKDSIVELKNKIGNKKVLCALSGGVDSSVVTALLSKAIGKNLVCIFVNHGLLRKYEEDEVVNIFSNNYEMNFIYIDASKRFYESLKGITNPEEKRKIIGKEFINVFEEEAKKIGQVEYLAQGTIYPDVVESGNNVSKTIKSHHNVGGLPEVIDFKQIIEPLRFLFKDEVRTLGKELGLPDSIVNRQPFPGPGLAIRIIGDVTEEKVNIVKNADYILRQEIEMFYNNELRPNQYYVALTNIKTVGVMGDLRTYEYAIVIRAVNTDDFMTATASDIPYDLLQKITTRIVNEVKGVNRVFYDLTSKPPATIEME